jgi:hypothetical protein
MDTIAVPWHTRTANTGYILRIGQLPCGTMLDEWGMTSNFPKRFGQHRAEHPGCQIIMIVDVGSQSSHPVEDAMKMYFRDRHIRVRRPQGTYNVECFRGPDQLDEAEYFARFQEYVVRSFQGILRFITFEGVTTKYAVECGQLEAPPSIKGDQMPPWLVAPFDSAVLIEQEKTKQASELTKQASELTKQKMLDLEILKLQLTKTS